MNTIASTNIKNTITKLYKDANKDHLRIMKGMAKSVLRPVQPKDFKTAYLAITEEQGKDLVTMIEQHNIKNIVEFGTSFGISTLFLAQGALATGGKIITTELLDSKAQQAQQNFRDAGVAHLIELRVGDAMQTLSNHQDPIDLLLLDGWKDLYAPLFNMLQPNLHEHSIVYVDNADFEESRHFLQIVAHSSKYQVEYIHNGKAALITRK